MSSSPPSGPRVGDHEDLYRAITYKYWWNAQRGRPSSAAFNYPVFSVDIASLTTPAQTLGRFCVGSGLVAFNCGEAAKLGFDARHEKDENFPNNDAHAHVYCEFPNKQRKKQARKLAETCQLVTPPVFA